MKSLTCIVARAICGIALCAAAMIGFDAPAWALPSATPQYELVILPPMPGHFNSEATGINSSGLVSGVSYNHSSSNIRAGTWTGGTFSSVTSINAWAHAVNDHGNVGGALFEGGGTQTHGFFFDGATVHDVHTQELLTLGNFSVVVSINNLNQAVGSASDGPGSRDAGFLWQNGVSTLLGTLGGEDSDAREINNLGQVVGVSHDATGISRPFLWSDANGNGAFNPDEMVQLPDAGDGAVAETINDLGQVAGWMTTPTFVRQPIIWNDASGFETLPMLAGVREAIPLDINNEGTLVGVAEGRAILWKNGEVYDLNDLIDPASGYQLIRASSINDDGWIVGIAIEPAIATYGFVLIPIPEPTSAVLCAGLGLFLSTQRRRGWTRFAFSPN